VTCAPCSLGWAQETDGGFAALPKGLFELGEALGDDLHENR
jgi:hypothetical protein